MCKRRISGEEGEDDRENACGFVGNGVQVLGVENLMDSPPLTDLRIIIPEFVKTDSNFWPVFICYMKKQSHEIIMLCLCLSILPISLSNCLNSFILMPLFASPASYDFDVIQSATVI
jgi:hypothetical protein